MLATESEVCQWPMCVPFRRCSVCLVTLVWPMCLGPFRKCPVCLVTKSEVCRWQAEVSRVLVDRWLMCLGRSVLCVC